MNKTHHHVTSFHLLVWSEVLQTLTDCIQLAKSKTKEERQDWQLLRIPTIQSTELRSLAAVLKDEQIGNHLDG